jgi:hypothetical protein
MEYSKPVIYFALCLAGLAAVSSTGCVRVYKLSLTNLSDSDVCVYNDEVLVRCVRAHTRETVKGAYYEGGRVWFKDSSGKSLWWFSPTDHEEQTARSHNNAFVGTWSGGTFSLVTSP